MQPGGSAGEDWRTGDHANAQARGALLLEEGPGDRQCSRGDEVMGLDPERGQMIS